MTAGAKGLEISENECERRRVAHRLDVVDFKPAARTASDAPEAIAAESDVPQRLPAPGSRDMFRMALACHLFDHERKAEVEKYSGYTAFQIDGEAMDIPTMRACDRAQYQAYVREELFFQDHHDVVRSNFGEYPIATTPEQIDAFIEVMAEWRARMLG